MNRRKNTQRDGIQSTCILNYNEHKRKYCQSGKISPFDIGIPLLDMSDEIIQKIYYFRWNIYSKHIKETSEGYVVTEFFPEVPWSGKYNTICCPAGHHIYEGRWLHNKKYLSDYCRFWFTKDAEPRKYSFWAADSIYAFSLVTGDFSLAESLFESLKENYVLWEKSNLKENGLFYQIDERDGMEFSISGSGLRPTINSYMYADAVAISKMAAKIGKSKDANLYIEKSTSLRKNINTMLWDEDSEFYKTLSEKNNYDFADVREEIGYIPWYFSIPDEEKSVAWKFLTDRDYFYAPFGPTTAEQNHPDFMKEFKHECLWNGPSWPFSTSQTLTAMGNLLNNYNQNQVSKEDYFDLLKIYASSHFVEDENGVKIPFIDENLDPFTGEWIARKKMHKMENPPGGAERGKDYNHSTFCDLIISGMAGIRPREDGILEVNPLFTSDNLEYMCLDNVLYHNHYICVLWDKNGTRYNRGKGFKVYVDGKMRSESSKLEKIIVSLL